MFPDGGEKASLTPQFSKVWTARTGRYSVVLDDEKRKVNTSFR